jgi:hypothetical protein
MIAEALNETAMPNASTIAIAQVSHLYLRLITPPPPCGGSYTLAGQPI